MVNAIKWLSALAIVSALAGCVTTDYASQLGEPNFGYRRAFSVDSFDPSTLMNGPYASKYSQAPCLAADYRCSPQAQLFWAESEPR